MKRVWGIAKWTGLALCLLIGATWTVSTWLRFGVLRRDSASPERGRVVALGADAGVVTFGIYVSEIERTPPRPWYERDIAPHDPDIDWLWRPRWEARPGRLVPADYWLWVRVPMWIPLALVAAPTAWLWWRGRRARPGRCACGYDLTGLAPDTPCPECGGSRTEPSPCSG